MRNLQNVESKDFEILQAVSPTFCNALFYCGKSVQSPISSVSLFLAEQMAVCAMKTSSSCFGMVSAVFSSPKNVAKIMQEPLFVRLVINTFFLLLLHDNPVGKMYNYTAEAPVHRKWVTSFLVGVLSVYS